jgi:acyl-CoA reductase-like NAD-dependent aldehyde dehydrogenase
MVGRARKIRIGDPLAEETQMGPLATAGQLSRIETEVAFAKEQGGTVLTGGKRPAGFNRGLYYEPTIVACPDQKMRIVDTELFGPVLCVLRFQAEDEVIRLANDSRHGLAAGVFTQNGARALRVTKALRAGIVWVNTYRVVSPIAEFGGSGRYGRESGLQAIYDYTAQDRVTIPPTSR